MKRVLYIMREFYTHLQWLSVWCGFLGDHTIGPFLINGNLNGAWYLKLLREMVD